VTLKVANPRDIKVRARGEGLWRISDAHCAYDPLHFVLFHPHGEPGWHPNITGATPAVVDGLSSEDEQQQPSEDEQQPNVEPVVDPRRGGGRGRGRGRGHGRGRGRGRGIAAGRIAHKVIAREYAAYFMHDRNPPTNSNSLMARGYIKSGWLTSTPRLRGSGCGGCTSTRPPCVLTNIKEW